MCVKWQLFSQIKRTYHMRVWWCSYSKWLQKQWWSLQSPGENWIPVASLSHWNLKLLHQREFKLKFVQLRCTKKQSGRAALLWVLRNKLSDPGDWPCVFPLSYTDSLTFPRVEDSNSGMFYSSYWLCIAANQKREKTPEECEVAGRESARETCCRGLLL